MPIYEYRCEDCGHEFERLQKISDPPPSECPQCSSSQLRKLISAVGFRLKGGGWYETDFKSGDKRNIHESGEADKRDKSDKKDKPAAPGTSSAPSSTGTSKTASTTE